MPLLPPIAYGFWDVLHSALLHNFLYAFEYDQLLVICAEYNFDAPEAFDCKAMMECMEALLVRFLVLGALFNWSNLNL